MLDARMKALIGCQSIGSVATIGADGAPAVSPKATFLVLEDECLAFANIRSPATIENLRRDPRVEANFIDPFHRTALRVTGKARYVEMRAIPAPTRDRCSEAWPDLFALMRGIVFIKVVRAEMLTSPSYDVGAHADELAETWLARFADDLGYTIQRQSEL